LRHLLRAVLAAAALTALPVVLPGATVAARADSVALNGSETAYLAHINGLRSQHGLAPLSVDAQLTAIARNWTAQMARSHALSHNPSLQHQVPSGWSVLGENVGEGPGVDPVWAAFVASPPHYANLVDPSYNLVGIGTVVDANGITWTTHDFEARRGSVPPLPAPPPPPAPPAPAPPAPAPPAPAATAAAVPAFTPHATPPTGQTATFSAPTPTTTTTAPPVPGAPQATPTTNRRSTALNHQVLVELEELRWLDATNG
jgi:hypothetical protein